MNEPLTAAEIARLRATQRAAHDARPCGCAASRDWTCPQCWAALPPDERARRRQHAHRRRRR